MLYMVSMRGLMRLRELLRVALLWRGLCLLAERQLLRGRTVRVTSQLPPLLISRKILMHVILCCFSFMRLFSIVFCLNSLYFCRRYTFSSNCSADGLYKGSFWRQLSTIERSSEGQFAGKTGYALRTFCLSSAASRPVKGWFQVSISQSRQPKAQISEWQEQGSCCQISGLVQQGVPILVVAMPFLLTALTFMSPSLTVLSSPRKKLAAFTSRWITCVRCKACNPCSISLAKAQISSSGKGAFSRLRRIMKWRKSPLGANSVTRQRLSCSKKASLQAMMWGWRMLASSLISLRQLVRSCCVRCVSLTCLSAQVLPSTFRRTRNTCEKDPSPTCDTTSKFCITYFSNLQLVYTNQQPNNMQQLIYNQQQQIRSTAGTMEQIASSAVRRLTIIFPQFSLITVGSKQSGLVLLSEQMVNLCCTSRRYAGSAVRTPAHPP